MTTPNSENTPTVNDIREKIKQRIKECPENWVDLVAAKMSRSPVTVKAYLYNGVGRKRHLFPLLEAVNEVISEFNNKVKEELAR